MENNRLDNFRISNYIDDHPLIRARRETRHSYYAVLEYIVRQCIDDVEYANACLSKYYSKFVGGVPIVVLNNESCYSMVKSIIGKLFKPRCQKYSYWLICDIAIVVKNKYFVEKARKIVEKFLSMRECALINALIITLFNYEAIPKSLLFAEILIKRFRSNRTFTTYPEMRFFITANMSAGKSTLINAIIGKSIARTSQEACTANMGYFLNKPFEDNAVHLLDSPPLNLNASYDNLMNAGKFNDSYIASYFRKIVQSKNNRLCLIDTPGVNSAINRNHGRLTHTALINEKYDKLIYVLNANKLGADEEVNYLRFISENVPKEKVIFVLNKLDCFNSIDDSIAESIKCVRNDLIQLGYEQPIICPLSAYFALLLKMKWNNEVLDAEENDYYNLYVKKFKKVKYDLSIYFDNIAMRPCGEDNEIVTLAKKCGIYGLESILYGR